MRGLPNDVARNSAVTADDIEALIIEGRFGRAASALKALDELLPVLERIGEPHPLLDALYARALLLPAAGAPSADGVEACDLLERAALARRDSLWAATACALRANAHLSAGDVAAATNDLARADVEMAASDLSDAAAFRLLDALAAVYAPLRLTERLDAVRSQLETAVAGRPPVERALHWGAWSAELAARALEPVARGEAEPEQDLLSRAVAVGSRLDTLDPRHVPPPLRRGVDAVRALAAAYRGRSSEALRILGQDAFGEARDLPPVERRVATLAAMRAHAHVGSLASARSLDAGAGSAGASFVTLMLDVCRARERLWLETHANGNLVPVLHRLTGLLVQLGWHGMDLVADTARQALEHHAMREESRTDALTGVGNRRALDEELRQLVRFSPLPLALVLIDVDDFKQVNDRFTHVVGDEVLRSIADTLSEQLRAGDRLLRYGGDEFVVLLPGTGDQEAHRVARRMARAVAGEPWGEIAPGLSVTITTGCAALWSLTGRRPDGDAERLFRRADEALLTAKRHRVPGQVTGAQRSARPGAAPEYQSGGVQSERYPPGQGESGRYESGGYESSRYESAPYESAPYESRQHDMERYGPQRGTARRAAGPPALPAAPTAPSPPALPPAPAALPQSPSAPPAPTSIPLPPAAPWSGAPSSGAPSSGAPSSGAPSSGAPSSATTPAYPYADDYQTASYDPLPQPPAPYDPPPARLGSEPPIHPPVAPNGHHFPVPQRRPDPLSDPLPELASTPWVSPIEQAIAQEINGQRPAVIDLRHREEPERPPAEHRPALPAGRADDGGKRPPARPMQRDRKRLRGTPFDDL